MEEERDIIIPLSKKVRTFLHTRAGQSIIYNVHEILHVTVCTCVDVYFKFIVHVHCINVNLNTFNVHAVMYISVLLYTYTCTLKHVIYMYIM